MFATGSHDGAVRIWTSPPIINAPPSIITERSPQPTPGNVTPRSPTPGNLTPRSDIAQAMMVLDVESRTESPPPHEYDTIGRASMSTDESLNSNTPLARRTIPFKPPETVQEDALPQSTVDMSSPPSSSYSTSFLSPPISPSPYYEMPGPHL